MRSIRKPALTVIAASAVARHALAGCSGGGGGGVDVGQLRRRQARSRSPSRPTPAPSTRRCRPSARCSPLTQFAYDSLVSVDAKGKIGSQLAKDWKVDGTTVTLTLNDGVTCSDGSDFTAKTAADNITWVGDPANKSPFLGAFLPGRRHRGGRSRQAPSRSPSSTPAPFVLQGLANLPMVCDAGIEDRSNARHRRPIGTGPYVLERGRRRTTSYTYTVNKKYTWGPGGATTKEKGTARRPSSRRSSRNETTAANLLLSGDVNAAHDHRSRRAIASRRRSSSSRRRPP